MVFVAFVGLATFVAFVGFVTFVAFVGSGGRVAYNHFASNKIALFVVAIAVFSHLFSFSLPIPYPAFSQP